MVESVSTRGVIQINQKPRVLLVDDVPDNLKLLGSLFDSAELELSFAKNGIRALKLAERSRFELAILDLKLPDIDGFELAKRIRKLQPECEIIFCSAYNDRENRDRGFLMGGIDFIEKPYDLQITRTRVKSHVERILLRRRILMERNRQDAILSNIRDAVITVNEQEIIVDWNLGASNIFGCSTEQIVGKPLSLLFPQDACYRSFSEMLQASQSDERGVTRLVNEMQVWSGERFMAELSISLPYELDTAMYTATIRRIADSVTLKQLCSLYKQALHGADQAYLVVTHEGVILEQSPAFESLNAQLNLSCGEVGTTLGDCLIAELFSRVQRGESEFSLDQSCGVGELRMRAYFEDSHRPAYLILFER